jgi:hypothetical protein
MALSQEWIQELLTYEATLEVLDDGASYSDSGAVGRIDLDGTLVVYDLEDVPQWLQPLIEELYAREEV